MHDDTKAILDSTSKLAIFLFTEDPPLKARSIPHHLAVGRGEAVGIDIIVVGIVFVTPQFAPHPGAKMV